MSAGGPFGTPWPGGHPGSPLRNSRTLLLVTVLFGTVALMWRVVEMITDWYWFQELGYPVVFLVTLINQLKAAALFGGLFFVIFYPSLLAALRLSPDAPPPSATDFVPFPILTLGRRFLGIVILAAAVVMGILMAVQGSTQWENLLRFVNPTPFNLTDPLYGRDISFYIFRLPFLTYLYGWIMSALFLTLAGTAFVYFIRRSLTFIPPQTLHLLPAARMHMAILVAALLFNAAFGFWIDLSEMLSVKRGVVFGPGYTDTATQIWVLKALIGLAVLAGIAVISYVFSRNWRIPAVAILALIACLVIGRGILPGVIQKFMVIPNEIVLEKPFLERNIAYTRAAYKLDAIEDQEFPADENLTREDLRRNDITIKNIRLWDHAPLLLTYSQLQEIRTYYKFVDVDNDRYTIDGEYRQVMLSPRELSYRALPARTWVNEHLNYTHGYGIVMGPVNRISKEGLPEFFIKDIPPVSTTEVRVTRPEIYFGEVSNEYVFVRTKRPEFDYPVGDKNVYARYEGKGGVPLGFWRKLLFAARFRSMTILFSDDITAESRVMYYRNVRERVSRIVPFARIDADPYLVVSPEGRLLWFLDAYTTSDRFPYSEPTPQVGNYIRNSFKAVVDAYDGSVKLYVSDPDDPILKTYARIFPGVFQPLSAMPEALKKHIRYPTGMLSVQARMYRAYHMKDPQVFYNKEDLWAIPGKAIKGSEQEMEPYYTIMRLPDGKKEEFILLVPFTPRNKDNMSAWMAARCDDPNYGRLIVYNFPKQKLVYGPRQIEARIDQHSEISKQISLWSQSGSEVIRGSLLAIPIEKALLYVEPLYLAAEKGRLPELKRVIVAFGNTIEMEENLEISLQRIFGGEQMKDRGGPKAAAAAAAEIAAAGRPDRTERQLAIEALGHYRKAQDALRQGNWSLYGEELRKMEDLLRMAEKRK
ncbi:MAG: hypothetical protein A4E73_03319 [Syntrophaceae bacterium PtaU1.Bin231]|nr:MAG: hypothetical protein A4E73_03319 [Syntrophaceae bacterium PtaU1.Bin231]